MTARARNAKVLGFPISRGRSSDGRLEIACKNEEDKIRNFTTCEDAELKVRAPCIRILFFFSFPENYGVRKISASSIAYIMPSLPFYATAIP